MAATLLTAILSFVSTNMDDIFVLMLLYAQTQSSKEILQVTVGQYCGIAILTALGVLGAWGTQLIPARYIGLLGFIPLLLGIRAWLRCRRGQSEEAEPQRSAQISCVGVALLTIANGGDNIGVYIPVFSGYSPAALAVTFAVFAAMTALWCYLGFSLANWPFIKRQILRYEKILVPVVLMALGLIILAKNYVF